MTRNNTPWEEDSIKVNDADGNLAFEVIDLVKPDKLVPTFVKGAEYSDWRKELEENWTNITTGNKVGQTFRHVSGTVLSTGGAIGGVETVPTTTTVYGDTVSAPDITSYTIQGYAVPFPGLIRKDKKEPVNARLDASQKVARMANADVSMRARVDEFLEKEKNIAKENDKIREANRAKAAAYVASKGFSWNKLEKEGALVDDKGYGIVIINGIPGGKIMTGKIKIGYGRPYTRKDTTQNGEFLGRKNSKGEWYYPNIPEMEARDGQLYKGMPVGKPVEIDLEKGVKEIPSMPPELAKLHARDMAIQAQLADFGLTHLWDKYLKFEELLAKKMGVGGAKSVFDYYMSLSSKNDWSKNHDLTGLLSDRAQNVLRDFFKNNPQIVKNYWGEYNAGRGADFGDMIDSDGDLSNVIGNLDQKAGDYIQDKGNYIEIRKAYDFDNLADLMGGKIGGVGALAYAIRKNIILQHMIEFNKFGIPSIKKSPTMKVIIRINKNTGEVITSTKGQDTRRSLSLDKPIVRGKSKTKKSNWRSELNVN